MKLQSSSRLALACLAAWVVAPAAQSNPSSSAQEEAQGRAQAAAALREGTLPTVTATRSERAARTAPATTTVVTRSELAERNASDLQEALRDVPGLTLSPRQVSGRKTVSLRGLESRHTLTLVDGRRIAATDDVVGHSDYQYGWLPMAAVERIEVVRGPMSSLYGSEALGGVINLIPRKTLRHWLGTAALSLGSAEGTGGESASAALFATGPLAEGLLLRAHGASQRASATPLAADPRYSEIEARESRSAGADLVLSLSPTQSLELGANAVREQRRYDDLSRGTAHQNRYDLEREHQHLGWQGRFGSLRTQVRAYRSEFDVQNRRTQGVAPTRPQHLTEEVADGFAALSLGSHLLTLGGEWRRETLDNAGLLGGSDNALHRALFVQDEVELAPKLLLTTGLRHDRHELFGGETSPRAYLVWQPEKDLVIKGGAGHAFKAPTLKQISPHYVGAEGPHTFKGNGALRPESSNSAELSAEWDLGGQTGALALRGSLFRTELRDLITYRLIQQQGPRRTYLYDNLNRARIQGLELGWTWKLAPGLSWVSDLTLLRAKDSQSGKKLADRPGTSANTHLAWRGEGGWSARLGANHTGSQTAGTGSRLPSYWLWNASLGKALSKQWQVRAGLENLGDLNLAKESPDFGYAERARRVFVSTSLEF